MGWGRQADNSLNEASHFQHFSSILLINTSQLGHLASVTSGFSFLFALLQS